MWRKILAKVSIGLVAASTFVPGPVGRALFAAGTILGGVAAPKR